MTRRYDPGLHRATVKGVGVNYAAPRVGHASFHCSTKAEALARTKQEKDSAVIIGDLNEIYKLIQDRDFKAAIVRINRALIDIKNMDTRRELAKTITYLESGLWREAGGTVRRVIRMFSIREF